MSGVAEGLEGRPGGRRDSGFALRRRCGDWAGRCAADVRSTLKKLTRPGPERGQIIQSGDLSGQLIDGGVHPIGKPPRSARQALECGENQLAQISEEDDRLGRRPEGVSPSATFTGDLQREYPLAPFLK